MVCIAPEAVLWFGEDMSAVPLRNNRLAASDVRSVTVLGATGSIGDSTMDLLRASPERYRVEALTANSNVEALAKLAKEFSARFVDDLAGRAPFVWIHTDDDPSHWWPPSRFRRCVGGRAALL